MARSTSKYTCSCWLWPFTRYTLQLSSQQFQAILSHVQDPGRKISNHRQGLPDLVEWWTYFWCLVLTVKRQKGGDKKWKTAFSVYVFRVGLYFFFFSSMDCCCGTRTHDVWYWESMYIQCMCTEDPQLFFSSNQQRVRTHPIFGVSYFCMISSMRRRNRPRRIHSENYHQ